MHLLDTTQTTVGERLIDLRHGRRGEDGRRRALHRMPVQRRRTARHGAGDGEIECEIHREHSDDEQKGGEQLCETFHHRVANHQRRMAPVELSSLAARDADELHMFVFSETVSKKTHSILKDCLVPSRLC